MNTCLITLVLIKESFLCERGQTVRSATGQGFNKPHFLSYFANGLHCNVVKVKLSWPCTSLTLHPQFFSYKLTDLQRIYSGQQNEA